MKEQPWLVDEAVRAALAGLDDAVRQVVGDAGEVPEVLALARTAGKGIRPALLLLAASFGPQPAHGALEAAAAVELLHVASLFHDDVIDEAPLRRGLASANARFGNRAAVLAGTFLFARATAAVAKLGHRPLELCAAACRLMTAGEVREVELAFDLNARRKDYMEVIAAKTAALLELPCALGSFLGGSQPEEADALGTYAHHLGLAFQLADDALDFSGGQGMTGKAAATDLQAGVYSFPVIVALRRESDGELHDLLRRLSPDSDAIRRASALVLDSGAVEMTRRLARRQAGRAVSALAPLPDTAARLSLHLLADFAANRAA